MGEESYIYDAAWEQERARLASLEAANDPYTKLHCEKLGVSDGWRCLEIGGGGGSIVEWLCGRVGPTGTVVATDLDTRFLTAIEASNLVVRRHDIVNEDLEQDAFDLVHSRFLLEHLPDRERVLDKMIAAVKPGGWLLAEDVDFTDISRADDMLSEHRDVGPTYFAAMRAFMRSRGIDPDYGGKLPERLIARNLKDVGAAARRVLLRGGDSGAAVAKLSTLALKTPMVAGGFVTEDDVERILAALDSPAMLSMGPTTVAAWGRKP